MKLKITDSLKGKIRRVASDILFDLIDGNLNFPAQTVGALRDLADEIERQNPTRE